MVDIRTRPTDPVVAERLRHAREKLDGAVPLSGKRSRKVSLRIDPALLEVAKAQSGVISDTDMIILALTLFVAENTPAESSRALVDA